MSSIACGALLLERLAAAGVDQVFGIPGNHTVALYRDFARAGIRHTTTRHEQGAAFMADGYARASGKPGVCVLISGPGLLNAATAIAQAYADSVPLLIVTGVATVADLGMRRGTLHELPDQRATASTFCRKSSTLLDPNNLEVLIEGAFACFGSARPGPVHIEIPLDLMEAPVTRRRRPADLPSAPGPDRQRLRSAAAALGDSASPLLLVGGGAVNAAAGIVTLAQRLDAPVLNTVNGKGICPDEHPLAVGGSPALPCLRAALADADLVLAIGTELGETDYDLLMAGALPDTSRWIRIDIDPTQTLVPSAPRLAITSDAELAVAGLLEMLGGDDASPTQNAQTNPDRASGTLRASALRTAIREERHWHPEMAAFFATIRNAVPDATLVGDSTRPTYYAAWQYECSATRRYFHSVSGFGTLGYALPAALGAAAAVDSPVIALLGDGGLQFSLPELITGAENRQAVPIIVWNNQGYAEIENSMIARNVPADSTRIMTPDFALAAAAHHCHYANPTSHDSLGRALRTAIHADAPTLVEVREADFLTTASGQWYS